MPFQRGIDMQRLVALDTLLEELDPLVPLLKLLPALQVEDEAYVGANVHVFLYDLILS